MNLKSLNMKKGLKKFWIVGSVFWLLYPFIPDQDYIFGVDVSMNVTQGVLVFWVSS